MPKTRRSVTKHNDGLIRMKQLVIAPWSNTANMGTVSYSTLGLGEDGFVYRYDPGCHGWIRYSMTVADCGLEGHSR